MISEKVASAWEALTCKRHTYMRQLLVLPLALWLIITQARVFVR